MKGFLITAAERAAVPRQGRVSVPDARFTDFLAQARGELVIYALQAAAFA